MTLLCGAFVYCCSVLMNGRATARLSASIAVATRLQDDARAAAARCASWSCAVELALWLSHAVQNR